MEQCRSAEGLFTWRSPDVRNRRVGAGITLPPRRSPSVSSARLVHPSFTFASIERPPCLPRLRRRRHSRGGDDDEVPEAGGASLGGRARTLARQPRHAAATTTAGRADTGATGRGDLTGSITISGSSTVEPISSVVAEMFNGDEPGRRRSASTVPAPATASSSSATARPTSPTPPGRSRTTRPRPARRTASTTPSSRSALDGLTVMTNPENADVTCLNIGDLYALFGPESEGIDTWNGADSLAAAGRRQRRASPTRRSRSPRPARSRAPTTRSSSCRASRTSPRRRACPRTTRSACATTTRPRRTTT